MSELGLCWRWASDGGGLFERLRGGAGGRAWVGG